MWLILNGRSIHSDRLAGVETGLSSKKTACAVAVLDSGERIQTVGDTARVLCAAWLLKNDRLKEKVIPSMGVVVRADGTGV